MPGAEPTTPVGLEVTPVKAPVPVGNGDPSVLAAGLVLFVTGKVALASAVGDGKPLGCADGIAVGNADTAV